VAKGQKIEYIWPDGYKGPVNTTMELSKLIYTIHIITPDEEEIFEALLYFDYVNSTEIPEFTEPNNIKFNHNANQTI